MSEKPPQVMRRVRLSEIIRQTIDFRGRTPLKLGMDWGGEIRALSANNVQMGRINLDKDANFGSEALYRRWMTKGDCERGDILFTTEAPLGNVAQIPDNDLYILSQRVILLKADKSTAEPDYLFHLFQSQGFQAELSRQSSGSTVTGIQQSRFAKIEVKLLPLTQQRRIAEILTTVDEAMEQTEALVGKLEQMKAGLMHDLFTRGVWTQKELDRGDHQGFLPGKTKGVPSEALAKAGHLRPTRQEAPHLYHPTPLGWLPKGWAVKPCSEICDRITVGIVVRPTQYYVSEGVPAFRSANIRETGIDPSDLVHISAQANALLAKSQVRTGDIVSVRTGYPGTTAVVPEEYSGANCIDILIATPSSAVLGQFLASWINSSFGKDQVLRKQGGLAQQHFNVGELRDLLVVLPAKAEQTAIVERLLTLGERIRTEQIHLAKLRQQKQGLMQDLLTGRVRVE